MLKRTLGKTGCELSVVGSGALVFKDETPESAAQQMAAIWNDVDAWWSSPVVREVLQRFKERYCHLPDDLLDRIEHALREVMAVSDKMATQ